MASRRLWGEEGKFPRWLCVVAAAFLAVFEDAENGAEEKLVAQGFFEQRGGAGTGCPCLRRGIAMPGNEDHANIGMLGGEGFQDLQAIQTRQLEIEQDTGAIRQARLFQKRLARSISLYRKADKFKQLLQGITHGRIVVDDKNRRL